VLSLEDSDNVGNAPVLSYGSKSTIPLPALESHGHPIIVNEAKRSDDAILKKLTEQILGCWIDPVAKECGVSKCKDSVLERMKKGNSPQGATTLARFLVCYLPVPIVPF
jgi:hypothetical protein